MEFAQVNEHAHFFHDYSLIKMTSKFTNLPPLALQVVFVSGKFLRPVKDLVSKPKFRDVNIISGLAISVSLT